MKKMKVNELYEQIMSLIKENSGSMLSFENEQEEAKRILHQQKELIDQLIQINQEMKAMINKSENDIDLNEIQALKNNSMRLLSSNRKSKTDCK
ncbi:hypothetical protein HSIEG1_3242 [Enterococcus sp. HSIEG1]|nr:hypothetical protein HSIEG1_3242 [Enterococcus sp. HSIEG1]